MLVVDFWQTVGIAYGLGVMTPIFILLGVSIVSK